MHYIYKRGGNELTSFFLSFLPSLLLSFLPSFLPRQAGSKTPEVVMEWLACRKNDIGSSRNGLSRVGIPPAGESESPKIRCCGGGLFISGNAQGDCTLLGACNKCIGWSWGAGKSNCTHLRPLSKERINPHREAASEVSN